ncbi:hypothetical protein KQI63_14355 [bacterium]|nr:hypothetical protein [bacterium]
MRISGYGLTALLIIVLLAGCDTGNGATDPSNIAQLRDDLAQEELWPGYDPSTIPLAIFLDATTWLYNYPGTPEGFQPSSEANCYWMAGKHPTIVANSSGLIDSVMVSTLLIEGNQKHSDAEWASIALHEGFHVYQQQHTSWSTNEADLFLYPQESAEVLANRRLETWALSQALKADDDDRTRWAATVLELRNARYDLLPIPAQRYECAVELVEGTAYYVESKARSFADQPIKPDDRVNPDGYELAGIRQRSYHSGIAFALLLDDFLPDWKDKIAVPDEFLEVEWTPLSVLLGSSDLLQHAEPMTIDDAKRDRVQAQAEEEAAQYVLDRQAEFDSFANRSGWAIELETDPSAPLFIRGFDPMNVSRLGEGRVLNKRYLALGNEQAELQVMNQQVLTKTENGVPLFSGVQQILITGLNEEPAVEQMQGITRYTFDGGQLVVRNAAVTKEGNKLLIRLHE